jgi:hypothetical protein
MLDLEDLLDSAGLKTEFAAMTGKDVSFLNHWATVGDR